MTTARLLWLLSVVIFVDADYDCLCNYNVELPVYSGMSTTSQQIGFLYEFDCKQKVVGETVDPGWAAIAFEHQLTYVKKDANAQEQVCQGDPPSADMLIPKLTMAPSSTLLPTPPPTTTTTTTTLGPPISETLSPTTQTPSTTTAVPTTTTTTTATTTPTPTTTTRSTTVAPTTPMPTTASTTTTPLPTTASTTTVQTTTSAPPTTQTPTSTTTATAAPFTASTTPSTPSTTVYHLITGNTKLCPPAVQGRASAEGGFLAQYDRKCYEVVPRHKSWNSAESDCAAKGGHLASIASVAEQQFLTDFLLKHYGSEVWIGLTDHNHEERFQWSSGQALTYTHWEPGRKNSLIHGLEDCVVLQPHDHGYWDDRQCSGILASTHSYVCEFAIVSGTGGSGVTQQPHLTVDGNTNLCPSRVQQFAANNSGTLGQYSINCYELIPASVAWEHAEQLCQAQGGHLAHIRSSGENSFLLGFVTRHAASKDAWIGLNDKHTENHFIWSSGNPLTFSNFIHNHVSSTVSHHQEDCVVFKPGSHGQWDDVQCGYFTATTDFGETHPTLCQFNTEHGHIIG